MGKENVFLFCCAPVCHYLVCGNISQNTFWLQRTDALGMKKKKLIKWNERKISEMEMKMQ